MVVESVHLDGILEDGQERFPTATEPRGVTCVPSHHADKFIVMPTFHNPGSLHAVLQCSWVAWAAHHGVHPIRVYEGDGEEKTKNKNPKKTGLRVAGCGRGLFLTG